MGLKLKKSPSFLDLIQMKLSQEKSAALSKSLTRKEKGVGLNNKLKASNVPATLLKIGSWEVLLSFSFFDVIFRIRFLNSFVLNLPHFSL